MSRPVDWSPLGRGSDPVPGDPQAVSQAGSEYRRVAQAIETAASRLRQIADHADMKSDAVEAFRESAHDVAKDISRAHRRYQGVGDALVAYATPLETAQSDSLRALRDAESAQADLTRAQHRSNSAHQAVSHAPEGTDTTTLDREVKAAGEAVTSAQGALAAARRLCDQAVQHRDEAATKAISAIREVEDSGDLKDSWWDDWGAKVVAKIAKIAGAIATIAGILALCVGWIPVIGQALAGILGTIALIAAAVSFLANLSLALTGYGSWTNVILDAVSLATFGIGRAVIGGARAGVTGARAAARLRAGSVVGGMRGAGSSAAKLRGVLGDPALAGMSRNAARSILKGSRKVPPFSPSAILLAAKTEIRAIPSQFRTVFNWSNLSAAWSQAPGALRSLFGSKSPVEFAARLTSDADTVSFLGFQRGLDAAVKGGDEVKKAMTLIGVGQGAVGVGSATDGYQFYGLFGGDDPDPATTLKLPKDAHAG